MWSAVHSLQYVMIAFSAVTLVAMFVSGTVTRFSASTNAFESKSTGDLSVDIYNLDYAQPDSLAYYPFDYVIEPYRQTYLEVTTASSDVDYYWKVSDPKVKDEDESVLTTGQGSKIMYMCEEAGVEREITLTAVDSKAGSSTTQKITAVCKYVRRELRSLSDSDRKSYLEALAIVYSTNDTVGTAKYGDDFYSYEDLTLKHMSYNFGSGTCTPYHDGVVFFTAHTAFAYEVERSLQSVDKTVSMAYWDYYVDAEQYGNDWMSSEIFSDKYFGLGKKEDNYVLTSGPFAYTPIMYDRDISVSNAFGRVTDPFNMNKSPYVQRIPSVCGMSTEYDLPKCFELLGALHEATSLYEFDNYLELVYHAPIHVMMGGVTDCTYDVGDMYEQYPQFKSLWVALARNAYNLWGTTAETGLYSCPTYCDDDAEQSDCVCQSDLVQGMISDNNGKVQWSEETTCAVFAEYSDARAAVSSISDVFETQHNDNIDEDCLRVSGATTEENEKIMSFILAHITTPGAMSQFTSAAASTNDPLFAPSHTAFERYFHYIRMDSDHTDSFDYSWSDDSSCYGRSWSDNLPFENFLGDTDSSYYTNEQLWNMFDPSEVSVPYIFDTLDDTCADYDDDAGDAGASEPGVTP